MDVIEKEIEKARQTARGGIVGVNIMVATQRYEIMSGQQCWQVPTALSPVRDCRWIARSRGRDGKRNARAQPPNDAGSDRVEHPCPVGLTKYWMKKYDRKPDFLVAEGPLAGGHLGFKREELDAYTPENYERELTAMIRQAAELEISLIAAGGIYDRRDLEHCLSLGAAGVQMGTRFVTTEECDAADAYKQAYLSARKEDIVIVKSPVGMPGRAIQNAFLEKVAAGERFMTGCRHCIKTCDPKTAPYCITRALINAAMGDVDNGLLFCGSNAWRAQKIERTVDIMEEMA